MLSDRLMHTYLLEVRDSPVGYVAFNGDTVHHLGVVSDHQRRGYGSALLEFACMEIFGGGAREAFCWVLADNQAARAFYRAHGWTEPASGGSRSTPRILSQFSSGARTRTRRGAAVSLRVRSPTACVGQGSWSGDDQRPRAPGLHPTAASWDSQPSPPRFQQLLFTVAGLALLPAAAATLMRVLPPSDDATALLAAFIPYGLLGYLLALVCLLVALRVPDTAWYLL